jgi:hypothetical protein
MDEIKKQLDAELAAHDQTKHKLGDAYRKIRALEAEIKKIKEEKQKEIEKLRAIFLTKLREVNRIEE